MPEVDLLATGQRIGEALAAAQHYGQVEIKRVDADVTRDADDEVIITLYVTLSDPSGDSWPFADVLKLRHAVWHEIDELGVELPVFIRLIPETDQAQEDDDNTLFPVR